LLDECSIINQTFISTVSVKSHVITMIDDFVVNDLFVLDGVEFGMNRHMKIKRLRFSETKNPCDHKSLVPIFSNCADKESSIDGIT
jgi:hypothetical protein